MAVWDKTDWGTPRHRRDASVWGPGRSARLAGAGLSVLLVLGTVVWGYKLAMRQIHGLPVIAAPEGPARVAPDNPGGELADHQGLAVNTIAAVGEAEGAADLLVLAPRPMELAEDDGVSDSLAVTAGAALAPPAVAPGPNVGTVQPSETLRAMRPAEGQLAEPLPEAAPEPVLAPDLEPVEAGSIEAALLEAGVVPTEEGVAPGALVSANVPGVSVSPIPPRRPGALTQAAMPAAVAPVVTTEVDPASLTAGMQLAQIGSYETEAEAKLEWDAAVARYGALFEDKGRVIQAAESGGRSFFRLRVAGFPTRDDARRFCAALKSGGQCVPVTVRQ